MADLNASARRVGDRYVLESLLGQGGAGSVWQARDTLLQRPVAVKEVRLPPELSDDERRAVQARILREARAAGRLNHPSVTTIYDIAEEDGRAFIVMELVQAPTLEEICRRDGPLEPRRAAVIGLGVLSALEAAHARGIVHRDVKPSNVMVDADDNVKLADFGIALVMDDPAITSTGLVLGSPSYMAPEQARESVSSPASDLWGLGATLYYAVEGAPPFSRASTIATVAAVLHDDPAPPRRAGPLAGVILSLLSKDPRHRPDAAALRELLGAAAGSGRAPAPPVARSAPVEEDRTLRLPADPSARAGAASATDEGPGDRWDGFHGAEGPGGQRHGLGVIAAIVVVSLLAAAYVALTSPAQKRDDAEQAADPDVQRTDAGEPETAPGQDPEAAAAPTQQATEPDQLTETQTAPDEAAEDDAAETADDAAAAPDGWVSYTDEATGYRLAHPPDWQVVPVSDTITDFRDPGSRTYLRVDWTDEPRDDPVADWQRQSESFGARHDAYEEIRIEPASYRGYEAALWEYRYNSDGVPVHAYNLGFTTGEYGHALNFQTTAEDWEQSQELFQTFLEVFEPAG